MVAINFLNYMDRWIASAAAPLIQKDFHLDDFQVGLLGTAFLLVYALAAVPFGWWADVGVRRTVVGVGVTIWSLATVFSGFARNYTQLFLTRAVLGIGEASYYPAGTSLLGDYFPKESRGRAMSVWGAGSAVGIAVGFAGGGYVAGHFGWQKAFFFAAIPGLLCAALAFTLREPLRGAAEQAGPRLARTADATLTSFLRLLRIGSLRATVLAQTVLYFVLAANAFWLPTMLHRRFSMDVSSAGLLSGVVLVLGGLVGTILGGYLADRFGRRRGATRANIEVGIAGFVLAAVLVSLALVVPLNFGPVPIFEIVFFLAVVTLYLHSGPFTAVSQDVVSPALRASAVTLLLFVSHVFGDSHSTADIGWLSDRLGSLQTALLITSGPLCLIAAFLGWRGLRHAEHDQAAMEVGWAKREAPAPTAAATS